MRYFLIIAIVLFTQVFALAQSEQAPIVEKAISYEDWTFPNVMTGEDVNLRKFAQGKKLVMVVYWAPWCLTWRDDIEFVKSLYSKYKGDGFDVIGVAAYDPLSSMKNHINFYKLPFTSVYETQDRNARLTSQHYKYRSAAGDTRKWGTPWYVFLDGSATGSSTNVLAATAPIVNGQLIQDEAEKFIRKKLGLDQNAKAIAEECDPAKPSLSLVRPNN